MPKSRHFYTNLSTITGELADAFAISEATI